MIHNCNSHRFLPLIHRAPLSDTQFEIFATLWIKRNRDIWLCCIYIKHRPFISCWNPKITLPLILKTRKSNELKTCTDVFQPSINPLQSFRSMNNYLYLIERFEIYGYFGYEWIHCYHIPTIHIHYFFEKLMKLAQKNRL